MGTRGRVWDGGGGNVGTRVRSAVGPAMDRTVRVAFIAWATRDGRTAIGVSVGRHAGSCCCVKRESAEAEMGRGRRVGVRGSVFGAGLFGARRDVGAASTRDRGVAIDEQGRMDGRRALTLRLLLPHLAPMQRAEPRCDDVKTKRWRRPRKTVG